MQWLYMLYWGLYIYMCIYIYICICIYAQIGLFIVCIIISYVICYIFHQRYADPGSGPHPNSRPSLGPAARELPLSFFGGEKHFAKCFLSVVSCYSLKPFSGKCSLGLKPLSSVGSRRFLQEAGVRAPYSSGPLMRSAPFQRSLIYIHTLLTMAKYGYL